MSTKMQFTLKVANKQFVLEGYQSLRGLRVGDKRPEKVYLKVDEELNRLQLERHIRYLYELLMTLEWE